MKPPPQTSFVALSPGPLPGNPHRRPRPHPSPRTRTTLCCSPSPTPPPAGRRRRLVLTRLVHRNDLLRAVETDRRIQERQDRLLAKQCQEREERELFRFARVKERELLRIARGAAQAAQVAAQAASLAVDAAEEVIQGSAARSKALDPVHAVVPDVSAVDVAGKTIAATSPPEGSLQDDPAVPCFVLKPWRAQSVPSSSGRVVASSRQPSERARRRTDPPHEFYELSYAALTPDHPDAVHSCNPRVCPDLSIADWYTTANKWNVLREIDSRTEPQSVLQLCPSQILLPPSTRNAAPVNAPARDNLRVRGPPSWQETWSRSLGKHPRVIVIGDVHGCIDELKELLRLADYQPGDQVILLGDLVAKGPDSAGVVALAREINAKAVRGNHDHEIVKWKEVAVRAAAMGSNYAGPTNANAHFSGSNISAEHARIGESLSDADHRFLREMPWSIRAPDLGFTFVHAGLMPGVPLTQQNPRLMMNMRSILDDGAVSAKNVRHRLWASQWSGPDAVIFGHDALRGLQVHDHAIGIDTGCVYGGRLTALLLPENQFISVPARQTYRSNRRRTIPPSRTAPTPAVKPTQRPTQRPNQRPTQRTRRRA